MSRFIDLSVALEDKPTRPAHHRPRIRAETHDDTFENLAKYYPGISREDLPEGKAWAVETLEVLTHAGTHMDAPWHYHPTTNHEVVEGGEPASTIDQIPLEYCFQPGVKLDFRHFPDGYLVQPSDIDDELKRIGHTLQPLNIVLVNTSAASAYGTDEYMDRGCGFGRAATLHLARQGIKIVGTDAFSWDTAFKYTTEKFLQTRDNSLIWEGHKAGREIAYYQIEKLHNLENIPSAGFMVSCFPIKIKGASAAWTRVVAVLD